MRVKMSNEFESNLIANLEIKDILVNAGAGTGKTTLLIERILTKLLNDEYGIDEILVVTFTRSAAEEMRTRIADKLNEIINLIRKKFLKYQKSFLKPYL